MNVVLIISSLRVGGAESVIARLANHWASAGESVSLITVDSAASDALTLDAHVRRFALGLMVPSAGALSVLFNNARRIAALRRAIRASGASVALCFEERTNVLFLLATLGMQVRRVIAERNDPERHRIARGWALLRRATYPGADALVVQTKAWLAWASHVTLGRASVFAIPNPAREWPHFAARTDHATCRIVTIARLAPQKAVDVLITAFASVAQERRSCELTVIGDGDERPRLVTLAASLGVTDRVTFCGRVANPAEALATADLFVLSSRYEGFPNALVEAMACGLAVISTAWTGVEEIITHDLDGLIVPIDDASALAAAMLRLVNDSELRRRLSDNARRVAHRFELGAIAQEWKSVLAPFECR